MTYATNSIVSEAMFAIRGKFKENLIPIILTIEDEVPKLRDPSQSGRALERIGAIAHKISGIAGSIGYEELGRCAADLDTSIRADGAAHAGANSFGLRDEAIETLLKHLEAALDEPSDITR